MSVAEIVAYVSEVWPDADFTDAELRIIGRSAAGIPAEAARLAIDDIRLKKASRKPALSWIAERFTAIRNQGEAQAVGLTADRFKNWRFVDTLRYGWAHEGYEHAMSMSEEGLLDRYWTIQTDAMKRVYGDTHAGGMAAKRYGECLETYEKIGFARGNAEAKAKWMLELCGVAV